MIEPFVQPLPSEEDHVSLAKASDIERWIRQFEVSEADLREAVDAVGCAPDRVRAYLQRR